MNVLALLFFEENALAFNCCIDKSTIEMALVVLRYIEWRLDVGQDLFYL